jgi:hypothetical protein
VFYEDFSFTQLPNIWQQIRLGTSMSPDVDLDGDPDVLMASTICSTAW